MEWGWGWGRIQMWQIVPSRALTDSFGILPKTGDSLPRKHTHAWTPQVQPLRTRVYGHLPPQAYPLGLPGVLGLQTEEPWLRNGRCSQAGYWGKILLELPWPQISKVSPDAGGDMGALLETAG